MSNSRKAPAAAKGRPFVKGDTRINKNQGPLCREAAQFAIAFKNALAKGGKPEMLAKILWDKALAGRPWAIEMLLDRLIGKEVQPLSGELNLRFVFADNSNGGE